MVQRAFVVLSNAAQLASFQKRFDCTEFDVFCDGGLFSESLKRSKIRHELLDDFSVQSSWDRVNRWGCEKAYGWIGFCRQKKLFANFDIPSATALYFSHLLVQGVKNLLFANMIIERAPSKVVIFPQMPFAYPRFSGNHYLNYFLRLLACERGIETTEIQLPVELNKEPINLRKLSKTLLSTAMAVVCWGRKSYDHVFVGSLKHLEDLMVEMTRRNESLCFYDTEFHWDLYKKVRALNIHYSFPGQFRKRLKQWPKEECLSQLNEASLEASKDQYFGWEGRDLTTFVQAMIFPALANWINNDLAPMLESHDRFLAQIKPQQIISEEDYALRGGPLAAFCRTKQIDFITISHASTGIDFSVPPEAQCFRQSRATIVNSDQEKQMYVSRGWDPSGFQILGIPRFDKLSNRAEASTNHKRVEPHLLYCANTFMKPQTPEDYGYLGLHLVSFDTIVKRSSDAIFKAVEQASCQFYIKPHNPEGLSFWQEKINLSSAVNRMHLITDKHTPITSYLPNADAMILSYWSTAIIEAIICGVPILFVDLFNLSGKTVQVYSDLGLITVVRSDAELNKAVLNLHSRTLQNPTKYSSVIGHCDGKSTKRVADYLLADKHVA